MGEVNVQTVVPETTYEALTRLARAEGRSIRAVVREAIEDRLRQSPLTDDPLAQFVGAGRLKEHDLSTRKDWRG
jgi:predicted DNA-binding protein